MTSEHLVHLSFCLYGTLSALRIKDVFPTPADLYFTPRAGGRGWEATNLLARRWETQFRKENRMSKPLLGGSAAVVALLSASLIFYARPSVAETLASPLPEIQQKGDAQAVNVPAADSSTATPNVEAGEIASNDKEKATLESGAMPSASVKAVPASEAQASSPTLTFSATAYSLRGRTASGKTVARGLIAADRRLLPIGTRVRLEAGSYSGEYLVADTGGAVRGRRIDIWVPSTSEAMRFGRRPVKLTVLTRTRPRTSSSRTGK